jgi:hypothetical protein
MHFQNVIFTIEKFLKFTCLHKFDLEVCSLKFNVFVVQVDADTNRMINSIGAELDYVTEMKALPQQQMSLRR